jgi:hypothetical protein
MPQIQYSEKYFDDTYEYRHVVLPPDIAKLLPKNRLLSEVGFYCPSQYCSLSCCCSIAVPCPVARVHKKSCQEDRRLDDQSNRNCISKELKRS